MTKYIFINKKLILTRLLEAEFCQCCNHGQASLGELRAFLMHKTRSLLEQYHPFHKICIYHIPTKQVQYYQELLICFFV